MHRSLEKGEMGREGVSQDEEEPLFELPPIAKRVRERKRPKSGKVQTKIGDP